MSLRIPLPRMTIEDRVLKVLDLDDRIASYASCQATEAHCQAVAMLVAVRRKIINDELNRIAAASAALEGP